MDIWNIGPLVVQKNVLVLAMAIAIALGMLKIRLHGTDESIRLRSMFFNALLMWVLVWKLSVLLFDWRSAASNPMSLLYFNGGVKGGWTASLVVLAYVLYFSVKTKIKPSMLADSALILAVGGFSVYGLLSFIFIDRANVTLLLTALLGVIILVPWLTAKHRKHFSLKVSLQRVLILVIGSAVIVTIAGGIWERKAPAAEDGEVGLKIGQRAPDFELKQLNGEAVKLSDFRGKTVILNFWATWCPPCKAEMPYMQQFYARQTDNETVVIGVNSASTEVSIPVVRAWVDSWGLTFPIVLDEQGNVVKTYDIRAYPSTYVIDAEGMIRDRYFGPLNESMLEEAAAKGKSDKK